MRVIPQTSKSQGKPGECIKTANTLLSWCRKTDRPRRWSRGSPGCSLKSQDTDTAASCQRMSHQRTDTPSTMEGGTVTAVISEPDTRPSVNVTDSIRMIRPVGTRRAPYSERAQSSNHTKGRRNRAYSPGEVAGLDGRRKGSNPCAGCTGNLTPAAQGLKPLRCRR